MKTFNAYCISKTHKDGDKSYLCDVKYWTIAPTEADYYDNLEEAESDLERILESNEYVRKYYKHTKGVEMEKPEYKIEKVTITFEED